MVKEGSITIRIDKETKEKAERIFSALGTNRSNVIQMLYRYVIINGGLPFDVKLPRETLDSIINIETGKGLKKAESVNDLFEQLDK